MENQVLKIQKPRFSVQWHLTAVCRNHCKHCYMDRNNRTLSLDECKKVVNDFKQVLSKWGAEGRVYLSGGDPLLYPHFFEVFHYFREVLGEETKIAYKWKSRASVRK
jgi:MoaA/NifB/PqqE/SkfB family radical SAM enzyme